MAAPASSKSAGSKVVNPKLAMHVMAPYLSSGDCPTDAPDAFPVADSISEAEGDDGCQPKPDSSSDSGSDDDNGDDGDNGDQEVPAEEEDGGSDRKRSRKRTRYAKSRDVDFELPTLSCFKGGYLQKPIVLELKTFETTKMLKVTGRQEWLCKAANGRIEK